VAAPATVKPSALDQGVTWQGRQLQSTPRELYVSQAEGPTVVVENDSSTGVYVTAVRAGDRLCLGANEFGQDGPEDWCDTAAVALPEEVAEVGVVHTKTVRARDGSPVLVAYGAARSEVAGVQLENGPVVPTSRLLPFWPYSFLLVTLDGIPATLHLISSNSSSLGTATATA
jgi:hypothetical protein